MYLCWGKRCYATDSKMHFNCTSKCKFFDTKLRVLLDYACMFCICWVKYIYTFYVVTKPPTIKNIGFPQNLAHTHTRIQTCKHQFFARNFWTFQNVWSIGSHAKVNSSVFAGKPTCMICHKSSSLSRITVNICSLSPASFRTSQNLEKKARSSLYFNY